MIPSAGFFCKSFICFTIAPTAPLETWSMMMMMSCLYPPLVFPQTASKTSVLTNCSLSLSLFVVVVVRECDDNDDKSRLEEKDAAPALCVVSRSFAQKRALCWARRCRRQTLSFYWGRKVVGKVFLLLWRFPIAFFFFVYCLGFQMVLFSSLSIGKEMCYQQHFSTETGHA